MIVPVFPPLNGECAERFRAFATKLACAQRGRSTDDMSTALEEEIRWCRLHPRFPTNPVRASPKSSEENALAYEACIRVLSDLARLRWRVVEQGYGFALESRKESVRGRPTAEIVASKKLLRRELQPVVDEQKRHPAVLNFITGMERTDRSGRRNIQLLTADGAELAARLAPARELAGEERVKALNDAIKPYLQQADKSLDLTTGHRLRDIWRYFRYSWSIPQVPTPGRQLLYLVRDRAHPAHPVIGIAALNNCPLEMGEKREKYIGWHFATIVERFVGAAATGQRALEKEVQWLEQQLKTSLAEIDWTNLVAAEEVKSPDEAVVRRLALRSQEFSKFRETLLTELADSTQDQFKADLWDDAAAPPVDDDVLKFEPKTSINTRMHVARKQLVARKRASALARLLSARLIIAKHRSDLTDPNRSSATLRKNKVRGAVNIVLEALKGRRAGTNLLEITTCGAIAPYNRILGGKLVTLLMLSPQVSADYRRRYTSPSIISSQMKNRPVIRDSTLVYLGTTSLYVHGSSQYNRLYLPAGTIAPDQESIRYNALGQTSGFGTIQFSPDTSKAVDAYLTREHHFKEVNSLFGEGTSPKLRKLKMGLRKLGFDPDRLIQHRHHRLIYGAPLFPKARDWLQERGAELPCYVAVPDRYQDATERIGAYWRRRWLASRLYHQSSMAALSRDVFVPLGATPKQAVEESIR